MPGKVDGMSPPFLPIGGLNGIPSRKPVAPKEGESDFKQILFEQLANEQKIKFSSHAQSRIESRNIELNAENLSKLAEAMNKAQEKGARDSLIFMRDTAFIVNLNNRTVVTAVDDEFLTDNVFTNIDSAVIVK